MEHKNAQSSMMEYLLMSFFVLVVIMILMFFLGWWHFTQLGMEREGIKIKSSDIIMKRIINSPIFVSENSLFDDSKLMAVQSLGRDICGDMDMLGSNWFFEIQVLNPRQGCSGPCDASNYPCCSSWEICPPEREYPNMIVRALPVNIYRKAEDRTDIGVIRAGVYHE